MLIFDSFPSLRKASEFAEQVKGRMELRAIVFKTQRESDRLDPFPGKLKPPIVLVDRGTPDEEELCQEMVSDYRGEFAGT